MNARKDALSYDATRLLAELDRRQIPYAVEHHQRTSSALETAEVEHVSSRRFAKTVVVRGPSGRYFLAVLPAHLFVDLDALWRLSRQGPLVLAGEGEIAERFPGCEPGAVPPIGRLWGVDVFVDDDIAIAPDVTFDACSHEHTLTLTGKDFLKAVEGVVGDFSARSRP